MSRELFAILGLAPGLYSPAEIERKFRTERARLLAALENSAAQPAAHARLERLHFARRLLIDQNNQRAALAQIGGGDGGDGIERLRTLIAGSLEGGLLRYSRRQQILAEARRIGLSPFDAQLLIAQVQFGDASAPLNLKPRPRRRREYAPAVHLLAALGIGAGLLTLLIWWVNL